ncbi:hypothetical protein PC118_g9716 [Phytophthora cactorum]|uniref:Uncharacterized protein n=2 Tax=Phytophthora cactorum TaxID=29920 RepID=A0A8T1G264_9STRA|nr:hypothetical protein PC112_g10081 [Phytophthora cactorum]KAG2826721.1 hypothetical protein PC111_g8858 [Phytophthora cactorum]KAG2982928.1 hypothetical protein PC118_g9716 [Phytophthora cactorum]
MVEIVMRVVSKAKCGKDIRSTVEQARVWVAEVPLDGYLPSRFQRFVSKAVAYSKKMEGDQTELCSITKVLNQRKHS